MYNKQATTITNISINTSSEGERIEEKIERITNNNEPISDGAEQIYTERKDGVLPAYDIRTDRWDVAIEAMSKVDKSYKAKREENIQKRKEEKELESKNEGTTKAGTAATTSDEQKS